VARNLSDLQRAVNRKDYGCHTGNHKKNGKTVERTFTPVFEKQTGKRDRNHSPKSVGDGSFRKDFDNV
jgi:hypothetical protein